MAIVKLFNLSEKVQVLVIKKNCESTDLPSIEIETLIDHDDAMVSGALQLNFKEYDDRDEIFNNKINESKVKEIANRVINSTLPDLEVEQYLIK